MSNSVAPKLLAEFIGTFALVFIGAGAASIVGGAAGGGITAVAFAHGLTLMIFIYAYDNDLLLAGAVALITNDQRRGHQELLLEPLMRVHPERASKA